MAVVKTRKTENMPLRLRPLLPRPATLQNQDFQVIKRNEPLHVYVEKAFTDELGVPICRTLLSQSVMIQKLKKSSQNSNKQYACSVCAKRFASASNMKRHMKNHNTDAKCSSPFSCGLCTFASRTLPDFETHIHDVHNVIPVTEKLKFRSKDDFEKWKVIEEKNTSSYFVQHRGKSKKGSTTIVKYYCSRSGNFVSRGKGKRQIKSQGTAKIGSYCIASMIVTECQSEVDVVYCKTHFGHTCSLGHIPISNADKQAIAGMLSNGVNFEKILDKIRNSVNSGFERLQLLSRSDKNSIKKAYDEGGRKDSNDTENVDQFIHEMIQLGDTNPMLFYKARGVLLEDDKSYQQDDFILMLMNDVQKEAASSTCKHDVICIDSPHGNISYEIDLTTILIVNEYEEAFPAAFLISNRHDFVVMKHFFCLVKHHAGQLQARTFMSDEPSHFYLAWKLVMGETEKQLLCTWLVDRAWRDKLNLISEKTDQIHVYHLLRVLIEMLNDADFETALPRVVEDLLQDPKTEKFGKYFESHYIPSSKYWAYCYRKGTCDLNANVHLESLNRFLKYVYTWGRNVKRLDKCFHLLLKMVKDNEFCFRNKTHKGRAAHKLKIIQEAHVAAEKMASKYRIHNLSSGDKLKWKVTALRSDDVYHVEKMAANSCCSQKCHKCAICVHQYVCSCFDAVKRIICRHIHMVVRFNTLRTQMILPDPLETMQYDETAIAIAALSNVECEVQVESVDVTDEVDKKTKLLERFHDLYMVMSQLDDDDELLNEIEPHITMLSDMINSRVK